jgi:biopolymer transport protein ExbD
MIQRRVEEEKVSLRLTPMVDVIFLLLIFFMYSARFRTLEGQLGVELPSGRASVRVQQELEKEVKSVTISLRWDGSRTRVFLEGNEFQETTTDRIFGYLGLQGALTEKLLRLKGLIPNATAIIDSDPQVPMEYLVGAVNSCVRAGWEKVSFLQLHLGAAGSPASTSSYPL